MSVIGSLVAFYHFRRAADALPAGGDYRVGTVHQVGADVARGNGMSFAAYVFVFVDGLFICIERAEADDDAMHRRHAFCLVTPLESAVGEVDANALGKQPAP